jgi:hypothetical protein
MQNEALSHRDLAALSGTRTSLISWTAAESQLKAREEHDKFLTIFLHILDI